MQQIGAQQIKLKTLGMQRSRHHQYFISSLNIETKRVLRFLASISLGIFTKGIF